MKLSGRRLILFRTILILLMAFTLEAAGFIGMWLNSRPVQWIYYQNFFQLRAMLSGCKNPELSPRYLTLPYLGYVPYPNYEKNGIAQHNADGYRGNKVPLEKTGKFRILCLGGSTTYGFSVDSPAQSFPARLEALLNQYIRSDSFTAQKYSGAEVINAGLDGGTSAEELQQYIFKYKYYHADAVVVHSGINDALLASDPSDFQLDYTHYRRINFHLEPLPAPMRWLMKSYFLSYVSIQLFYREFSIHGDEFKHQYRQTFCKWTNVSLDSVLSRKTYTYYPYYENTRSLFREIISDSACLVVFPNILNQNDPLAKSGSRYTEINTLNVSLSQSLCGEFGGMYVAFNFDSIKKPARWIDDCHVDAEGEKQKAQILSFVFKKMLDQSCSKR